VSEDKVEKKQEKSKKLDRTKKVVKKYWKPFTVGVVFTVVTVVVTKRVFPTKLNLPVYMDMGTMTKRLGRPSNITKDLTTGDMWGSQGAAARARGISQSRLSQQVTGKTNHINGHRYATIGKLFG
jgi:hypothetical protein